MSSRPNFTPAFRSISPAAPRSAIGLSRQYQKLFQGRVFASIRDRRSVSGDKLRALRVIGKNPVQTKYILGAQLNWARNLFEFSVMSNDLAVLSIHKISPTKRVSGLVAIAVDL